MPTKHGRWYPGVRDLCSASVVMGRPFSARDVANTIGHAKNLMAWLKTHGHIKAAGRGRYQTTAKGDRMFGKACRVRPR